MQLSALEMVIPACAGVDRSGLYGGNQGAGDPRVCGGRPARQASLDARQLLRVSWLVEELERALDQTDTRMQIDMLPHRNRRTR